MPALVCPGGPRFYRPLSVLPLTSAWGDRRDSHPLDPGPQPGPSIPSGSVTVVDEGFEPSLSRGVNAPLSQAELTDQARLPPAIPAEGPRLRPRRFLTAGHQESSPTAASQRARRDSNPQHTVP